MAESPVTIRLIPHVDTLIYESYDHLLTTYDLLPNTYYLITSDYYLLPATCYPYSKTNSTAVRHGQGWVFAVPLSDWFASVQKPIAVWLVLL